MKDKTRLIIDFDNDEEMGKFYARNVADLKKLELLESKSNNKIKTYKTEFEDNTRAQFNTFLASKFAEAVELARNSMLNRRIHQEEILLLDKINDFLQEAGIIKPDEVFYNIKSR